MNSIGPMTDEPETDPQAEPEDGGDDDDLFAPAELVELHEVLEWAAAVATEEGSP